MDAVYSESTLINVADLNHVNNMPSSRLDDFGNLDNLIAWHCIDPVSEYERRRNDIISSY